MLFCECIILARSQNCTKLPYLTLESFKRNYFPCLINKSSNFTLCAVSSGSPPLIKMPFVAPVPVPTMTAVGVAKPRAHGHAIDNTVIANLKACSKIASCLFLPLFCVKC